MEYPRVLPGRNKKGFLKVENTKIKLRDKENRSRIVNNRIFQKEKN